MTREEATELLKQYNLYSPTKQIEEAVDMAIEALSADAEWIPCSERLPNDANDVLVCMRNGWIYMASYRHNRRLWKIDANGYDNCEIVIAWMPLPKPYKGGDAE